MAEAPNPILSTLKFLKSLYTRSLGVLQDMNNTITPAKSCTIFFFNFIFLEKRRYLKTHFSFNYFMQKCYYLPFCLNK